MDSSHTFYMSLALELAERGQYSVSPNPMVGCVIVKNQQIIGQGWHQFAGQAHAEIIALQEAGENAQGATVYINLEPCCHYGKTPPCVNALICAKVECVYVACLDPNPLVCGKGIEALKAAGIRVVIGVRETQAKTLNRVFFHYIKTARPYVISKWAMSLDGQTITHPQDERSISEETSIKHAHQVRRTVDAIVIGAHTAMKDNPLLTVRYHKTIKHPLRFILASQGNLPLNLKIFNPELPGKTIVVVTKDANPAWLSAASKQKIKTLMCAKKNGKVDLHDFLDKLGQSGISSLLVEGGEMLHTSFFIENLVNHVHLYLAPKIISQLEKKQQLSILNVQHLEQDIFLEAIL